MERQNSCSETFSPCQIVRDEPWRMVMSQLIEISDTSTRFNWSEDIECSRLQFLAIYPFLWVGVRISLARLSTSLRPPE